MAQEFDLKVYYFSDASVKGNIDKGFGQHVKWDVPLLDGYSYQFIRNYSQRKSLNNRFWDLINPGVIPILWKDVSSIILINGWSYFSVLLTIVVARLLGKKVWLRAENPLNQDLRKSRPVRFLKRIFLSYLLFKLIDKALYIGTESKKFFQYYGVNESRLVFTPYAVDNNFFQGQHKALQNNKERTLMELGLPSGKIIILYSGKYIPKKRPLDLIHAFKQLKTANVFLVMVGDGILRSDLEKIIEREKLSNVLLTGFVNQSTISKYYSVADIYVMCSGMGETWGLSVNEAMNFGLPVIITETCGSSCDLVENGVNGFVVPEGDILQLKNSMEILIGDGDLRVDAGKKSLKKIGTFSINSIVMHLKTASIE